MTEHTGNHGDLPWHKRPAGTPPHIEMAAFDRLPPALRGLLRGLNISWSARQTLDDLYDGASVANIVYALSRDDRRVTDRVNAIYEKGL